ncbi:phosphatase PAP2 family protein [[Clostridium] leptum]|nr:phosphatase PAP2 family protein [[Clostridium] leptum]
MGAESQILDFIQKHLKCGFLDTVLPFITKLGNGGILWIVCTVVFLMIPKTRRIGLAMAVSLALEVICCNIILKPLVARIRPCDIDTAVQLLVNRPTDFSFPSGHAGASFAAVSVLYFEKKRLWIPAGVIAVLIAFSRLYLYVHYPSDVLAGAMIGIMLGWVAVFVTNKIGVKSMNSCS